MPIPAPDPTGRPSTAKNAAAPGPSSGPANGREEKLANDLTGSHHQEPLSEVLRGSSSSERRTVESDIAQFLSSPQSIVPNTDDAPTVITQHNRAQHPATPIPLPVSGETPSIAGRRLGNYELIEAVGAGGMAAVLKARDLELGRIVALKILPPEAARDPEGVNRFKQEARAAARLDHENIARVYSCGEDQGLHFIAFEFVEGDNLRVLIDRAGTLPPAECIRYMMQVAAGLHHAAERGVVHRDIKPSNILITPDRRAKIVDMGLARHLGSESANGGVTQSGVTLGTFDYISPEQALDPRRADVRSDIYSLGCTFYHALTGRPPVPEGTAAKKLQAHQQLRPLDPRELNRAIPDELAVILARMMAKDPAQRYQAPSELIAHLKGLAERLKIGSDAVAHDAAAHAVPAEFHLLPESPRFRPGWILAIAAAAVAVAAFIAFTGNPGPTPTPPPADSSKTKGNDPFAGWQPPPTPNPNPPAATVRTVDELIKKLEDPKTTKITLAPGRYDLTQLDRPVVFQGEKLELIGAQGGVSRLLLSASETRGAIGSLALKAESLTVRGIWFEFYPEGDIDAGPTKPVGLRLDESAKVELTDCVFIPYGQSEGHEPRSVWVTRAAEGALPQVTVRRCLFAPGAMGLIVPAGSTVNLDDCGFAPHSAALMIESPMTGETASRSDVRLDRSSFMLDPGASVIEAAAPANLKVTASDSVFAPANGSSILPAFPTTSDARRRGVVIRVRGDQAKGVQFEVPDGRTNAYHEVDPLGTAKETLTFEQCRLAELPVEDKGRVELKQRPWWEADPLKALTSDTSPWRAFRLKVESEPAVFVKDKPHVIGVAFHNPLDVRNPRRAYPDINAWPPPRPLSAVEVKTKVWYPDAKDSELLSPAVARNLSALLDVIRPGDEILIRHNGPLAVDSIELKSVIKPSDGKFKVTIKPYPDCKPVLMIKADDERDQTIFKLKNGEVIFDGIHFVLKPNRPKDTQLVAAVAVLGGEACTFRNCAFTLAEEEDSQVAAVLLPDIDKVMAMDPMTRPVPKVRFVNCLLRGKGRGVWASVSRPFDLEATNTFTALDGPVILAEAGGKATGSGHSTAKFTRVTAIVAGPVIEMRGSKTGDAMKTAGLVPIDFEADDCLFAAMPGAGRALVELDGVDPADVKNQALNWRTTRGNRYASFDDRAPAAIIRPGGESTPKEWDWDRWIDFAGEPPAAGKPLGKVKFEKQPEMLKELLTIRPADVAVKMIDFPDLKTPPKPTDLGATLDLTKLPLLPEEMRPEPDPEPGPQ
ncbi:MAG: serine/threonine protein kinase [Planctomycetia bacterium]|nr:serine/threonine protein kinase [Planctomycetia bacterium]